MDFWNAQSLFMRFFPLVAADDKPKGIYVFYMIFILFQNDAMRMSFLSGF